MTSHYRLLGAVMLAIAVVALAIPAWVVTHPPAIPRAHRVVRPTAIVPPEIVPPVEPVQYQALAPEDAVAFNATIPFSDAPNPAARPFRFYGGDDDLARARDCLAAAVWFEAGDDAVGERAVAQVVLNRVRHPAFPHTVCGVVFQGAERRTGCQFTFACDGAMTRTPSPDAWERARDVADRALAGSVDKPIGTATHYHTNWVVPYWSSSLDKITEVHTHLFFRWTGWWGTPPAFRNQQAGTEPVVRALARLSPAHGGDLGADAGDLLLEGSIATPGTGAIHAIAGDPDSFVALIPPGQAAESLRALAIATCGERARCMVRGWSDANLVPTSTALTPQQMGAMAFSYLRDRAAGFEKPLWNCALFTNVPATSCMKRQVTMTMAPAPAPTPLATPSPVIDALVGIRRKPIAGPVLPGAAALTPPRTAPVPAPSPSPTRPRSAAATSRPPA